jgi:hypothetical protein
MLRFMGEQVTSVLEQRPQIFEARFQGVDQVNIQEQKHALLLKTWECLRQVADIEMAGAYLAVFGDISFHFGQAAPPSPL